MQRRGVLAGAAIDATEGLSGWQQMVEDLRSTWDREDHERSAASFPLTPNREQRWLDTDAFRDRVDLAVDRHRRDGMRFELHRLEFPNAGNAVASLCESLPTHVRDSDCLCQPFPHLVLLLASGENEGFTLLRRRLLSVWEQAWQASGMAAPAAAFVDRHVALAWPEDTEAFCTAADVWLVEP